MFQRTLLMTPARVSGAYTARTLAPTSRYLLHTSPIVSKTTKEKVAEVADKVRAPPLLTSLENALEPYTRGR